MKPFEGIRSVIKDKLQDLYHRTGKMALDEINTSQINASHGLYKSSRLRRIYSQILRSEGKMHDENGPAHQRIRRFLALASAVIRFCESVQPPLLELQDSGTYE